MNKIFSNVIDVRNSIPFDKTIALIAGCFDLLHVGHVRALEYSKQREDILVVCVLSDACVRTYKDHCRPVIEEVHRAQMLAALECVDRVYIANRSPSDYETLSILRPSSLVYGIESPALTESVVQPRVQRIKSQFPHIKSINYLLQKEIFPLSK
jgi:cytidyltransferase-like protein